MIRTLRRVVVLSILFMLAAPAGASERGTFRFDPERLSQAQKDFATAVQELNASGDQDFLINAGRKGLERKRKAYDDCVAKRGQPKCGDAYGDLIKTATLYMDRGFKAVQRFENHLNLASDLRYELGRLLYQHSAVPPDRTLDSLQVTLAAPSGNDVTPAEADIAVELLQTFASLTQQANSGPGGYPALLSRIVNALEGYRLFFLVARRNLIQNVAIPEQGAKVLEGLGDSVEVLIQGEHAPLRGFPLPDHKNIDDYKTLLPEGLRSLSPKR